jgi:hypothetical protein
MRVDVSTSAELTSVKDLVAKAMRGEVRVPVFQRAIKWRSTNVIDLFDSIHRGFPIGSLLMNKRSADSADLTFGSVEVKSPQVPDAWWVVDGQQRLTSLVATLQHPKPQPVGDVFAIWFNLETQEFFRRSTAPPQTAIPLRTLGDHVRLLHWANEWSLKKERGDLVNRAFELQAKLLGFQVPFYVVNTDDDDVLRQVFRRSNNAGVAMTENEVFQGLYKGTQYDLQSLSHELKDVGLDVPNEDDEEHRGLQMLLSCVKAIIKEQATNDIRPSPDDWDRVRAAVRASFRFLVDVAGVPNLHFLPYHGVLPQLARYFDKFPEANIVAQQSLARFVWHGAFGGAHGRINKTVDSNYKKAIDGTPGEPATDEDSATRLLQQVLEPPTAIDFSRQWNRRHAGTKLAACLFAHAWNLDVDPGAIVDDVFDHDGVVGTARPKGAPQPRPISPQEAEAFCTQRTGGDAVPKRSIARLTQLANAAK